MAYIAGALREQLREQQRRIAAIRAAAVATMLRDQSLAAVGRILGVSKSAVQKVHREGVATSADNPYFTLATKERSW